MYDSTHVEIYVFCCFPFFLGGGGGNQKEALTGRVGGAGGDWKQSYMENVLGSNFFIYI